MDARQRFTRRPYNGLDHGIAFDEYTSGNCIRRNFTKSGLDT